MSFRFFPLWLAIALVLVPMGRSAGMPVNIEADGFEYLIDLSGPMDRVHGDSTKLFAAVRLISKINAVLPEAGQIVALRKFGHNAIWTGGRDTELVGTVSEYRAAKLPLERLEAGVGFSPMDRAIKAADQELSQMPGRKVLLIFSDFESSTYLGDAQAAVGALSEKYGDDSAGGDLSFRRRSRSRSQSGGHCR